MLLSLDLSTKSAGWAVSESQTKLVDYGCITATSSNVHRRIDKITAGVEEIINKYDITEVAIEEMLLTDIKGNRKVFKALMYLQAFVVHMLDAHKIDNITFYNPSEWRAKCKIKNGRGVKRETEKAYDIAFVKENFNIDANDDVCDAISIGYAHYEANPAPTILEGGFELG